MIYRAWITKAAKKPMALETVDLGPLGAEDVEVAVEHCGLCHSDLSYDGSERSEPGFPLRDLLVFVPDRPSPLSQGVANDH